MLYDPSNPLDVESAKLRFARLLSGDTPFEMGVKRFCRTLRQNAYLHLLLQYFAVRYGESVDYVKRVYYKMECNKDIFLLCKDDALLHRDVKTLRSSRDLTSEEMSLSIERFKAWSSKVACIVLPDAENEREIIAAQLEVERNRRWL